jgi:hypothetical protein
MCEFTVWHVLGAVALAILSPKDWHDVALRAVREKLDSEDNPLDRGNSK